MSNINEFKQFVKNNPSLLKYVQSGEMTWQKFYEIYDMYGSESETWNKYITKETVAASSFDLLTWLKNVNVDSLQENINSVKRVISVLQDLGTSNKQTNNYKPRPIYKHFED